MLLLITVVLVGFFLATTLVRPLQTLTRAVQRIGEEQDWDTTVDITGNDEFGTLGRSFNTMTHRLKVSIADIERRNRDVQAIVDVTQQIATIVDEERLLQDVVDLTKERFDLYHAHIYRLNDTGDILELTAGAGYVGRQMVAEERIIDIENPDSIVAGTARSRGSAIVNDVRASDTFLPHPLLPDTRSELAVALVARGQLLGVLDVQSDEVGYFDETTLEVMQTLAAQIAGALSNARLFQTAQRSSRHALAISSIQENMQTAVDLDDMLQRTARELAKALRVPYAAIELKLDTDADNKNGNQPISEFDVED
ncbi:MAG: GAF domain-containing protein [Anaerolineae bacterium]|nr:GAF domain-containing protein [Anaerolineae bacterium]